MLNKNFKIGKHSLGKHEPVFIIAEAGANHNGDMILAKELIEMAKESGADCVKFQTFSAEEFVANKNIKFSYFSQGKKVVESEFDMLKKLEFERSQWEEIINYCKKIDITFLTTIQDPVNLNMMVDLGLEGIKVGSDDFDHLDYLKIYVKSGLPVILSRGMAPKHEIENVINTLTPLQSCGLAILHCISLYPTELQFLNLNQIKTFSELYPEIIWGFSDHSQSTTIPALSVACGAKIIEKHITLDHNLAGPDHWFSMNSLQLNEMVKNIREAEQALGTHDIVVTNEELKYKKVMRRRAIITKDIKKGSKIQNVSVTFKRSDEGIFIENWKQMLKQNLILVKDKNENDFLVEDDFMNE